MSEHTGTILGIKLDLKTDKMALTLLLNERQPAADMYYELKDIDKLQIKIEKYREKRSLDANKYCWKLCTEIANVLRSDKDTIYVEMLKSYGQSAITSVRSDIDVSGFFKYYDEFGTGTVKGKKFTHYKVYKGSSEYDTREMSILLDGIVSEAKELGIDTQTPEEIARMKALWGEKEE